MADDDEVLCRFGTPLDPLQQDEVPSKKPIAIEDQIVTDENGKRRFHGAFTGGFSAGFWNTVGSLEGWQPQSFKSSRLEKADNFKQKPTDFMDDEDLGEFGFAPQRVQTTADFTTGEASTSTKNIRKRKLQQPSDGPIPGVPVLNQLLEPARDKVAIRLLKRMGWKPGQGIGARQSRKEKRLANERNERERYVMQMYGCELKQGKSKPIHDSEDSDSDFSDPGDITFAPDDFEHFVCAIKNNTFGLGYEGLSRDPVLSKNSIGHVNLFQPFEILGKNNQKLSIRGQAFGVGALEEDDEDIYAGEDMTKYDFSLDDKKRRKTRKKKEAEDALVIEGFREASATSRQSKKVFHVSLHPGFSPRNWAIRKSRFEALDESRAALLRRTDEHTLRGLGRHDLDPERRGEILGEKNKSKTENIAKNSYLEKIDKKYKIKEPSKNVLELITSRSNSFIKGEVLNDSSKVAQDLDETAKKENENVQMQAKKITESMPQTSSGLFKPFASDELKQSRYEKFLEAKVTKNEDITTFLATLQPLHMSEWDREMEKKEFIQARNMYKPLEGIMMNRFITESSAIAEKEKQEQEKRAGNKVVIKRMKIMWKPCSQLCKRFNISEPFGGSMPEQKVVKKSKFSVFDYLENSINTKANFVTPVIIPKHIENPMPIVDQANKQIEIPESTNRVSAKDFFVSESAVVANNKEESNHTLGATSSTAKSKSIKPASELEQKCEEKKNVHPSEKKDLFKAIFDSSSEDEAGIEEQDTLETTKSVDIIASLTKPAAEINILRNTSPPRGIFAALLAKRETKQTEIASSMTKGNTIVNQGTTPAKIEFKPKEKRVQIADDVTYGPRLPDGPNLAATLATVELSSSNQRPSELDSMDSKLLKLLRKSKKKAKIVEEWVEKVESSDDEKHRKKGKKEKKHKTKHKKDSKKHKKDKKKGK